MNSSLVLSKHLGSANKLGFKLLIYSSGFCKKLFITKSSFLLIITSSILALLISLIIFEAKGAREANKDFLKE
nr:hypothetical protein [Mycoplasma capricolum]